MQFSVHKTVGTQYAITALTFLAARLPRAPGTLSAIFPDAYHLVSQGTGRKLRHGLGIVHLRGSFLTRRIFLPMCTLVDEASIAGSMTQLCWSWPLPNA